MSPPDGPIDADFAREMIEQTVAGYAALRQDELAWVQELREREELSSTLGDGLDE